MALAPFFSRAYTAIGAHLGITRADLEEVLSGHIVGVHFGQACSEDGNQKWIAELLVNLLSRLYPVLCFSGDESACKSASQSAEAINPDIEILSDSNDSTIIVCIGEMTSSDNGFMVGASGWVAFIGDYCESFVTGPANPYSAGAAAALAVWRVFQTIFVQDETPPMQFPDVSLSLLDYGIDSGKSEDLPTVDVGEVAVAGIGAVGNPAIWAWARHVNLTGMLHLIDPEPVELSNLQRYCLPKYKDNEKSKIELAQRELALNGSALSSELWPCCIEEFAANYDKIYDLPTICVSVDNIEGRRTAQALLPRLVVNGWTGVSRLGASWHRFVGDSACLGCLYHPTGTRLSQTEMVSKALGLPHDVLAKMWVTEKPLECDEVKIIEAHLKLSEGLLSEWIGKRVQDVYSSVICGQVEVDLPGLDKVATVPLAHQSVLAGILMAAELVKRSLPELEDRSQSEPLVIWNDIRMPPKRLAVMRAKNPECFCGDKDYVSVYQKKWN